MPVEVDPDNQLPSVHPSSRLKLPSLCRWTIQKQLHIPASADFLDYSGMSYRGNTLGIISQVSCVLGGQVSVGLPAWVHEAAAACLAEKPHALPSLRRPFWLTKCRTCIAALCWLHMQGSHLSLATSR